MNKAENLCGVFIATFALCGVTMFVGCGDDSSTSVNDVNISSSIESPSSSAEVKSSSSENSNKKVSSSSIKENKTAKSSSSAKKDKSSSSVKSDNNSSSSKALTFEDVLGKCEDKGQYVVRHVQDDNGNWFSCYRGEWTEGLLEVEGPDWGKNPDEVSSSSVGSSNSVTLADPCKTNAGDNCEYETLADNRDGKTYKTVKIGSQWWMAQNLDYETESSSCYNNADSNCTTYGRLYTWAAAMDSVGAFGTKGKGCGFRTKCSPVPPVRGICPEGWHLPDQAEWETLFEAVGGKSTAAKELRSATGWNNAGEDRFAFSALPAGSRELENSESADGNSVYLPGEFSGKGYVACFWSSTETLTESEYTETAYRIYWENKDDNVGIGNRMKSLMMGVRCVKD